MINKQPFEQPFLEQLEQTLTEINKATNKELLEELLDKAHGKVSWILDTLADICHDKAAQEYFSEVWKIKTFVLRKFAGITRELEDEQCKQ